MSRITVFFVWLAMYSGLSVPVAAAQQLSLDVEAILVPNVGAGWVTVETLNTYTLPVVACTYNLPSRTDPSVAVRMRNAGASSFDIRLQQFENSSVVTASDVHCLVVDQGAYVLPGGLEIEAYRRDAVVTNGQSGTNSWNVPASQDVTASLTHTYSSLVMLGQVMTFNDVRASVFWTNNCVSRSTAPNGTRACVGKHVGQIPATRATETLGYIAIDAASGTVNDVQYLFDEGPDSITGVNAAPHTYSITGDFDVGVLTQSAEDGGQGGWAVLYGADPLPNGQIVLGIEEEVVAGDTSRSHTTEPVFYGLFRNNQTATISASKDVAVYSGAGSGYALPGDDVIYTITSQNTGSAPVDTDTLFLVDSLPAEVTFYNGDIDDGGPETGAVAFNAGSTGLTFTPATDLGFSNAVAAPATFAACNYVPSAGYDANVRHVCIAPKGTMAGGTLIPASSFEFQFRTRLE